jgi:hypothetical protein
MSVGECLYAVLSVDEENDEENGDISLMASRYDNTMLPSSHSVPTVEVIVATAELEKPSDAAGYVTAIYQKHRH